MTGNVHEIQRSVKITAAAAAAGDTEVSYLIMATTENPKSMSWKQAS